MTFRRQLSRMAASYKEIQNGRIVLGKLKKLIRTRHHKELSDLSLDELENVNRLIVLVDAVLSNPWQAPTMATEIRRLTKKMEEYTSAREEEVDKLEAEVAKMEMEARS